MESQVGNPLLLLAANLPPYLLLIPQNAVPVFKYQEMIKKLYLSN